VHACENVVKLSPVHVWHEINSDEHAADVAWIYIGVQTVIHASQTYIFE